MNDIDNFTTAAFSSIIANTLRRRGVKFMSETGLEILTDLVISHASDVAARTAGYAARAGRTEANSADVFCALNHFDESPRTLAQFTHYERRAIVSEFLIDPYPLPRISKFSRGDNRLVSMGSNIVMDSFKAYPERFTWDFSRGQSGAKFSDLKKQRESDQSAIKMELATLLQQQNDVGGDTDLACSLDQPPGKGQERVVVVDPMGMKRRLARLSGKRTTQDPEFLKALTADDRGLRETPTARENDTLVKLLLSEQPSLAKTEMSGSRE